jgi:hypothetical protein
MPTKTITKGMLLLVSFTAATFSLTNGVPSMGRRSLELRKVYRLIAANSTDSDVSTFAKDELELLRL